jgi:hypothetical protein
MGQKFFLHKNEKVCYHIINTCSCELFFLGKLAGLTRRGLVYARETTKKRSCETNPEAALKKKDSLAKPILSG